MSALEGASPKEEDYIGEQIVIALRQAHPGTLVGEVIRKMGMSTQTVCRRKEQYGQTGSDEIRR
jgi:hypothetical protein